MGGTLVSSLVERSALNWLGAWIRERNSCSSYGLCPYSLPLVVLLAFLKSEAFVLLIPCSKYAVL